MVMTTLNLWNSLPLWRGCPPCPGYRFYLGIFLHHHPGEFLDNSFTVLALLFSVSQFFLSLLSDFGRGHLVVSQKALHGGSNCWAFASLKISINTLYPFASLAGYKIVVWKKNFFIILKASFHCLLISELL